MRRKFISLALCLFCLVSLSACGTQPNSATVNQEYKKIIQDSAEKLKDTYTDYIIATSVESPIDLYEYLDVIHGDDSYTEVSVNAETGEYGTEFVGTAESQTYTLVDWLTADGNYYTNNVEIIGAGTENCQFFKMPSTYNKYVEDRPYMYIHDILDNATYIKEFDAMELDLGTGAESFITYEIGLKSSKVKEIIGIYSYCMYKSVVDDKEETEVIKKFCNYRLEDLNMNLTFSDAKVIVGIDNNGILKYMCLETGGLGTRLYYSKAVIATSNDVIREQPDFSGALKFSATLQEFADFVSEYDDYDDAMKALNSMYGGSESISVPEEVVGNAEGDGDN